MESLTLSDDDVEQVAPGGPICLDLNDAARPQVTWESGLRDVVIKITTDGQRVDMTIGREAIRQLRQALDRASAA